jgi:hypothetical protein
MNGPNHPTVLIPVGKQRELPDQAVMVLRGLWARLGYQANSFVEMQLEITKELAHADFAKFEREMLCNEVISLRQEVSPTPVIVCHQECHLPWTDEILFSFLGPP